MKLFRFSNVSGKLVSTSFMLSGLLLASCQVFAGQFYNAQSPDTIQGRYIVVFKSGRVSPMQAVEKAQEKVGLHHGKMLAIYKHTINGFATEMDIADARALANDPDVAFVEPDFVIHGTTTQYSAPPHLDIIDQRGGMNGAYNYSTTASSVNVYILDNLLDYTNPDFGGRATNDADILTQDGDDTCPSSGPVTTPGGGTYPTSYGADPLVTWHATWIAGLVGGAKYGVAKGVHLHGVRVSNCYAGSNFSTVIEGLDWVLAHAQRPAIVSLSLETPSGADSAGAFDSTVDKLIDNGIIVVTSAGNDGGNACNYEPGNDKNVITVGAVDYDYSRWDLSNYGSCVTLFAPGVNVESDTDSGVTGDSVKGTGTSASSPIVAGRIALYLQIHPTATEATIKSYITGDIALHGAVKNGGSGSPNIFVSTLDSLPAPSLSDDFAACAPVKPNAKFAAYFSDVAATASSYQLDISIAGGSWSNIYAGTYTIDHFSVPSLDGFRLRARYTEMGRNSPYSYVSDSAPQCPGTQPL
ncbi:MAG TPA: S8 family peptidase [Gammaproteobacteria bacterium]|nr:S8 family peptidase [Gammaproteobacteria bacterium]